MEQNTKDWLEWRKGGLGSSDAPIVMGISPFKTRFQLWEEKTGRAENDNVPKFITDKGHRLEPIARAKYEFHNDLEMPGKLCQHKDYPFLRASMDGANDEALKGLEIKYVGKEDWEAAKNHDKVPEKYFPQLQHQLLCSGFESIDYLSFYLERVDGKEVPPSEGKIHVINVKPDLKYLEKYLETAQWFWGMVQNDTPPETTDKDIHKFIGDDSNEMARKFIFAHEAYKKAEEEMKAAKDALIEKSQGYILSNYLGEKIKVSKVYRKGSVDYKKVPELEGVDLDHYRKKQTFSWQVRVSSKS